MGPDRRHPDEAEPGRRGGLGSLTVEVPEHLGVVGEEAQRHDDDGLSRCVRSDLADRIADIRLEPGHVW